MKIVKIMVLLLIGIYGTSSMLYTNTGSNPPSTLSASQMICEQVGETLKATTWNSYLTVTYYGETYDTIKSLLYPNIVDNRYLQSNEQPTLWENLYQSFQHGAALAFLNYQSVKRADIELFQLCLTSAQSKHPDARYDSIQYTLYLTYLYIATLADNLTDYWSALRYGIPSGSSSGTTILDLTINNPAGRTTVASFPNRAWIQGEPQIIFANALRHGIDLTFKPENFIDANVFQKPGDVETLTALSKFQNLLTIVKNIDPSLAGDTEIQEKFYTGYLSLASNSNITKSIDTFWTMLSQSVPAGKNIFDIVLRKEYTPYNETTLTAAIYAALQRGISLATLKPPATNNLSKFQSYIIITAGRFTDNKYSAQNTYVQNFMFSAGISYINTGVSTVDEFWSILQNCAPQGKTILDIVLDPYYDYITIANVGTDLSQMFQKIASFTLNLDDLKRIQAYFTQALKKYASAFAATKIATQEKLALKSFSILSTDTTITTATSLISSLGSDSSNKNYLDLVLASDYVVQNQIALKSALITFFTRYAQILTAQDDIALLQSYLTKAKSKLGLDTAAIQNTLDLTLIVRLNAIKSQTPFDSGIKQLTQALALTAPVAANITNLVNAFGEAFDTATSMATLAQCDTLNSLLTTVPTWLSSSVTRLKKTISDRKAELQGSDTEAQLITNLTAAASATKLSDITAYLTNAAAITTPRVENASTLSTAFSNAFKHAVDIAANLTDLTTLKPILDTTQTRTYLNNVWTTLNTAYTQKQQQLKAASDAAAATTAAATAEQQLIANLKAATTFAALLPLLTTALASTYTPVNEKELASNVVNAFTVAINAAVSLDNSNQLSTLLKTAPGYFTSNVATLAQTLATKQQQLKAASDAAAAAAAATTAEQQLIANLKTATTFAALLPLLTTALASTYIPVNATELTSTVAAAFTTAINAAATLDNITQLSNLLKAPPTYFTSNVTTLTSAIAQKQQQLKTASDTAAAAAAATTAEQQLIANLKTATTFAALLPLLTTALASTYIPVNATELVSTVAAAFTTAINAASTLDNITQLSNLLKAPPSYFTSNVATLTSAIAQKQQQLKTASDTAAAAAAAATAEQQLIANLKAATTFSALLPLLTTALASTYIPVNATELASTVAAAFTTAINIATSTELTQLSNLLKAPPTYFTSNVATLTSAITQKQQQLKTASDTAAAATAAATAEQQLIANLKAATTFAALLPLLTTALASTYTPINATNFVSAVASAFTTAINTATSLDNITQLSNLLKAPPTYFTSNVATLTAALTTKQQQLQATNTAAAETTIIATLKSTKTTLDTLFSTFDTVLASTYKPISLSTLKAAMLTGLTRTIALITAANYATDQSKITSYISRATPKYITTAQKTSLSKILATKIKSIRTSLISAFVSKINSFKTAAAAAITTKTKPATVLTQRQTKFTSAFQAAAAIIDAYVQLAPSTSELALSNLKSAFTNFNASIIKLIQDQGFIKKSTSGKTTTYKLAYNATAAEPKASLKKVLTFMGTTKFPQLTTAQKNIIISINASIL
ncbi:MAG: hypothetical protein WC365_04145 [Candidatus Babeliales bacterium]|jgi:uncharacterized protein YgfB (UPF0149 family)